jgi:hypothetical protein
MKKTLLGAIAIVLVGLLYYFTIGSKQITQEIKKGVNSVILELSSNGFTTNKKELTPTKEHIEIELNNTQKIEDLLKSKGFEDIDKEQLLALQGAIIGIDLIYNPSPTKAVAMDIYPIKLPTLLQEYIQNSSQKEIKKSIEEILKNKTVLVHIEINKLATAFEGYLKDINIDNEIKVLGFKFNGGLEPRSKHSIKFINETIDMIELKSTEDNILFKLLNLKANIKNPLDEPNKKSKFSIELLEMKNILLGEESSLIAKNIKGESFNRVGVNSLIDGKLILNVSELNASSKKESQEIIFKDLDLVFSIKNSDMKLFKQFNNMDKMSNDKALEEFQKFFQALAKDKFQMEIEKLSVADIILNKNELKGFELKATLFLDDSIDISALNANNIFDAFNIKLNIEASNELISAISNNPNAMVIMMILQPIDKNGKKVYNIEYSKGSLKINGKPFL